MPTPGTTIVSTLMNAPLPKLIENLGLSIATAQAALDKNSIAVALELVTNEVEINGKSYNLISLGFVPTFYAFTDAMIEAKMAFSMTQSTEFKVGGGVTVGNEMIGVNISAEYGRKFSMSAEGSSSVAARLVALPVPDRLNEILSEIASADD